MALPFWEILNRSKDGPVVEEKHYDLSLFKKTQELQKKYGIKYDSAKPLDIEGELADRVFRAGAELFLDLGTYCTTTKRVIKVTEQELKEEIQSRPDVVEMGQGRDRVKMVHREVEGQQEPIVIAGIQTAPFSDEQMMFKISKGCAEDRCVDGIWGGILLKIDGKYDVIAGAPSEIYQYRKTSEILRRAINAAELYGEDSELAFVLDRRTRRALIRLVDRKTKQVLRELPSDLVLSLAESVAPDD